MKAHARRKLVGSWPARRQDDADSWPSRGNVARQVRPAHGAGHADVREKQANVRVCIEESEGLVGISGFEHAISGVQEHVGCPQSLENIVFDNQNYGVGGAIGH